MEYQIKFTACLLILFLFYKWILEKESFHFFKRFYLLLSLILASIIPVISIPDYRISDGGAAISPILSPAIKLQSLNPGGPAPDYLFSLFLIIYFVGLLVMGCRFIFNLRKMWLKVKNNPIIKESRINKVLLEEKVVPHTFLTFIFLSRIKYLKKEIPQEVILHEESHAGQYHSIDILIVELLQVLFWFNPIIYLIKKSIKLNHEFLADQAVLRNGVSKAQYWEILLAFNEQKFQPGMANAINYSSIKKRLRIMKKRSSVKSAIIRRVALLPLICLLLYGFGDRTPEIPTSESVNQLIQEGASKELVAEYNKLARKYNEPNQDHTKILNSELQRISYIYSQMSLSQRKNAEPFPSFATPPLPPDSPSVKMATEVVDIPPAPGRRNGKMLAEVIDVPPPPAAPDLGPSEFIEEMASKNARFYYNGEEIDHAKAAKLVKQIKDLKIITKASHSDPPEVFITNKRNK